MSRLIWLGIRIAVAVALVVVPCGYAITGVHTDVLLGAGCAVAVGVGVGLRGGSSGGLWTGILIGSMVGVVTAFLAGGLGVGWGFIMPSSGPLALGLIGGLDRSSLSGYRGVSRETFILAALFSLGLIPGLLAGDASPATVVAALALPLLAVPWTALLIGLISQRREEWDGARPPRLLVLGAAALPVLMGLLFAFGVLREDVGFSGGRYYLLITRILITALLVLPLAAFLGGRAAAIWLRPRLQVYGQLADYLRVMWVPIGGFAVGYLMIIVLFAGFYGMLERFSPGAFADAAVGIKEWIFFAFYTGLAQDYATVVPVSDGARLLVGAHLILSAGWVVVLFAAVMSFIGPKLERIARRHAEEES